MWDFPLFPEQASTIAPRVDTLYFALILLSLAFAIPICLLIIFFAIRYRTGAQVDRSNPLHENLKLELSWIIVPLALAMGIFAWAASLYIDIVRTPANALPIYVVGKQWMWYTQHPEGHSEINSLHVPVGRPIKLIMASQDVIHSFYIPAFRIKQDVLPGRYTEVWFEATKTGTYHLHCTEYCGSYHSVMGGTVTVMEPVDYQQWLASGNRQGPGGAAAGTTMSGSGEALFEQLGCNGCHRADGGGPGPSLVGIFGQPQPLTNGQQVVADEQYLRESILQPNAKIVEGYEPLMPSYEGQVSEEQLLQLIEYIKGLGANQGQENAQ